jgi:RNA recognition motif-containing protein
MPADRMTLKRKGFAFITFDNSRSAKKAMNINGHKVMDKSLKVSLAENKKSDDRDHHESK